MKILVSLLSDQLPPNLLFIKEKQAEVQRHLFVTTNLMEQRGKAEQLARVAGLAAGQWQKVVVIEDSLDDIRHKLAALALPTDTKYLLNLTGGTKIMSIGVSRFFEEYDHESYYSAIGTNAYKRIFPRDNDRETPFAYALTLAEYFDTYGFQIIKSGLPPWATETLSQQFYHLDVFQFQREIRDLRTWQQKNRGLAFPIPPGNQLTELLRKVSWQTYRPGWLGADEIQFLISGWWEAYLFFRLKKDLALPDAAIATGCHIRRDGATNEMDIVFLKNNKLFVVECKTGFDKATFKDNFNDAIYKMAALRSALGLRVPGFLAMLDLKLREQPSGNIKKDHADRAKAFDTTLIDRKILNDAAAWQGIITKIK
ncbi:MAG: Card1-like endonuclease domain-containing protein [Saprospiraceae bacterium]